MSLAERRSNITKKIDHVNKNEEISELMGHLSNLFKIDAEAMETLYKDKHQISI